jgi:hypothetical protein
MGDVQWKPDANNNVPNHCAGQYPTTANPAGSDVSLGSCMDWWSEPYITVTMCPSVFDLSYVGRNYRLSDAITPVGIGRGLAAGINPVIPQCATLLHELFHAAGSSTVTQDAHISKFFSYPLA